MKNVLTFVIILLIVVFGLFYYFGRSLSPQPIENATSTIPSDSGDTIGKAQMIKNLTLTPVEVLEDSRCATDVQCIWAGTLKVRTEISIGSSSVTDVLELGKPYDNGNEVIVLSNVSPGNLSGKKLAPEDYHFTFTVTTKFQ